LKSQYEQQGKAIWTEIHSRDIHEKTQKQEENMIPMTDVVKLRDSMHDVIKAFPAEITAKEHEYLLAWILICLYTRIPPRRNQDYVYMQVVDELPVDESADANYYVTSTKEFVFNKYKTKKHYGQQVLEVPDELVADLELYMKWRPERSERLLVHHDGSVIHAVNGITRILNRAFGKRIGATALRHIYLSDKYANVVQERQADAAAMAHSVDVQATYIKL
jgi:integrase